MGEADGAKELPVEDRNLLIVEMVPSDEEDEAMETDEDGRLLVVLICLCL